MSFSKAFRPASILIAGATVLFATATANAIPSLPIDPPDTNAQTFAVEIDGGEMVVIVNGETLPGDRIQRTRTGVVILDERGEAMHELPKSLMSSNDNEDALDRILEAAILSQFQGKDGFQLGDVVVGRREDSRRRKDDHDRGFDPGRLLEVLKKHLPELFESGEVHIDVEQGNHGFAMIIEVGDPHWGDDEEGDRHHEGDEREHDDHGHHDDRGHQEDQGHHEDWQHHAEAMFTEMHHGMENFAHEMQQRLEEFAHEVQERFEMMEHGVEERLHAFDRARDEMARHFEQAFEETHHRLEEEFRRRDEQWQGVGGNIRDTFRRQAEQNQRLEQRLQRLEAAMQMNRSPQGDRDMRDRDMRDRDMNDRERQMHERHMHERQMRERQMRERQMRERGSQDREAEHRGDKGPEAKAKGKGKGKARNRRGNREGRNPNQQADRQRRDRSNDDRR